MKILHCCLAAFYIDGYGYQENVLPKMHKMQGHDVAILASTETYTNTVSQNYLKPSKYYTEIGIPITRVPYRKFLPQFIMRKLRIYVGLKDIIQSFEPDIIFIHDCQFLSIGTIASYVKKNPYVRVYVDGHTDLINSAKNFLSRQILHRVVYRWCAKKIEPFTKKFYGVLPVRVKYLRDMYGISEEKIEYLPLGVDDSIFNKLKKNDIRESIRKQLNISDGDFVIVTGGKIDKRKNIHTLIRAVTEINHEDIKLIVFGTPDNSMKSRLKKVTEHRSIRYVGWISSEKVYNYFIASDLAFFPGTHSVLWEQAIGTGIPCVFKRWIDMQHVDLGGNCIFINSGDVIEIKKSILKIYCDKNLYSKMKRVAIEEGMNKFSYSKIAMRAIEQK